VTRVLAIADDLTGALEAGAVFAAAGMRSVVLTARGWRAGGDAEVVVVDTETRHVSPDVAEAVVAECAAGWDGLIYKKTDSTLRGNIAAELRALGGRVAYVPAYPAMGRTVVNGRVWVDGVPLEETSFARDALNPVRSGEVRAVVDPACDCVVFDGETDAHVEAAGGEILRSGRYRVVAGPAAIAGALARTLGRRGEVVWPRLRTCLVVNGSRHEVSRGQVEGAGFDEDWRLFVPLLADGIEAAQAARCIGSQVCGALAHDGLMVFGGDTAYGILECLGGPALYPMGEVVPGVPVSRIEGRREVLITKAGGFGTPDLIGRVRSRLGG
jgi:uncharacterized protein YgbK (DUF1537 family)